MADTKPTSAFSSATWKLLGGGRNCVTVTRSPDDTRTFCGEGRRKHFLHGHARHMDIVSRECCIPRSSRWQARAVCELPGRTHARGCTQPANAGCSAHPALDGIETDGALGNLVVRLHRVHTADRSRVRVHIIREGIGEEMADKRQQHVC